MQENTKIGVILVNAMISYINKILVFPNNSNNYHPILKEITRQDINNNTLLYSTMLSFCNADGFKAIKLTLMNNVQYAFCKIYNDSNYNNDLDIHKPKLSALNLPPLITKDHDSLYVKSLQAFITPYHYNIDQEKILSYLNNIIDAPHESDQFYSFIIEVEKSAIKQYFNSKLNKVSFINIFTIK